jgi:hypothetical protein
VRREEVRVREQNNVEATEAARRDAMRDMGPATRDTTDVVDEPDDLEDRVQ